MSDSESDSSSAVAALMLCGAALLLINNVGPNKRRRWWVRPWLKERDKGNLHLVNRELQDDPESLKNFLRMDQETFDELLILTKPFIIKQDTHYRESISAKNRLIITLRYLATGETMKSLSYSFRVGHSTIAGIIKEVTNVIYNVLQEKYLKVPNKTEEWERIAQEFNNKWQFPNALGALDGKHLVFQAPRALGSTFFNYKGCHSVVLLAMADANAKFLYVDIGTNGRMSDGGVYNKSSLFQAVRQNLLNFPKEKPLPGRNRPIPYVIIGDSAFPLNKNLMKPFPLRNISYKKRIFNYRLSRARRIVENAFGILANRWRILLNSMNLSPECVISVTKACVVLHNFLMDKCHSTYFIAEDEIDKRYTLRKNILRMGGNHGGITNAEIREEFASYFTTTGAVDWQDNRI